MENAPQFRTAIPKRRYRLGEFEAVVLSDIEAKDGKNYIHVFALVREGENDPCLYVVLERVQSQYYRIVVTVEHQLKQFAAGAELTDIDMFTEASIDAAVQLFKLDDEEPYRLM